MTSRKNGALVCGIVAGPLFVVVGLVQAFARQGFDLRDHNLSLLSNGQFGWIQITSFVVTGLLFVVCASGLMAVLASGRASKWGPRLVGLFGTGMVAAGVFVPDPAFGFPPGTPHGKPDSISWHGAVHYTVASLAFLALIAACFVFVRRFRALGQRGWMTSSALVGVLLIAGLAAVSSGSRSAPGNITFVAAALLGFLWVSALAMRLRSEATQATASQRPSPAARKEARSHRPLANGYPGHVTRS